MDLKAQPVGHGHAPLTDCSRRSQWNAEDQVPYRESYAATWLLYEATLGEETFLLSDQRFLSIISQPEDVNSSIRYRLTIYQHDSEKPRLLAGISCVTSSVDDNYKYNSFCADFGSEDLLGQNDAFFRITHFWVSVFCVCRFTELYLPADLISRAHLSVVLCYFPWPSIFVKPSCSNGKMVHTSSGSWDIYWLGWKTKNSGPFLES